MVYQFKYDEPYETGVKLVAAETKESAVEAVAKVAHGSCWRFDCERDDIQYVGGYALPYIFLSLES